MLKEGSKKLIDINQEDFMEVQEYFHEKSIENLRMAFRIRCQMLPDCLRNFKANYIKKVSDKYSNDGCTHCPEVLDLTNIMDMTKFFR